MGILANVWGNLLSDNDLKLAHNHHLVISGLNDKPAVKTYTSLQKS